MFNVSYGLDDEFAPSNTTEVIIHPTAATIQSYAFAECDKMKRCIMHNNVVNIEECAFSGCIALSKVVTIK